MDTSNSNVDIMSDSECSESSARTNGNTSSSESSDSNNSEMSAIPLEPSRILKQTIELPVGLCENASVFDEFFSLDTWNTLAAPIQDHLKQFLPRFSDNPAINDAEQTRTVRAFFNNELQRFGAAPLLDFQRNLEGGNYRPDIARYRANLQKSQRREQRFQESERISRVAKAAMISREKLLKVAYDAAPGGSLRSARLGTTAADAAMPKLLASAAAQRSRKRYFHEISAIAEDTGLDGLLSDVENYADSPPVQLTRKQRRHLGGYQSGPMSPGAESRVMSTMATKGGLLDHIVGPASMAPLTDDFYRQAIFQHKKRKLEDPDHPELVTADINLQDILGRAQLSATLRRQLAQQAKQNSSLKKSVKIKTEPSVTTPPIQLATALAPVTVSLQPIPHKMNQSMSPIVHQSSTPSTMSLLRPIPQPTQKTLTPPQRTNSIVKQESGGLNHQFNEPPMLDDSQHHYDPSSDDSDEEMEPPAAPSPPPTPSTIQVEAISAPMLLSSPIAATEQKTQRKKQAAATSIKLALQPNGGTPPSQQHIITTPNRFSPTNPNKEEHVTVLHDSPTLTMKMEPIHANNSPSVKVQTGSIHMAQYGGTVKAATFSDLEGIDMMHLPVDLDDSGNMDLLNEIDVDDTSSMDIVENRAPELMQETHVCFFSLVRDIFCSTPNHRTTMSNLQAKVSAWLANPITALNDWYSSADNWLTLLDSGIQFLAGEFLDQPDEFVPYVEYKAQLHIYQWIGAGRDSDQHLSPLCDYWLVRRNEMGTTQAVTVTSSESGRSKQNSCSGAEYDEGFITLGGSLSSNSSAERPCSPPPPRFPTSWTVVKASDIDIEEFRLQERNRFDSPHMSFTYRLHGFESVVGPVKGIYTQIPALTKARGHTMLTVDRPNFVTILTLVRDATARLPNGEGTRSDICELLRSSQYINPEAADNVLQTIVSGALDRMHTEHDPCVRYDPKRKIWIYLHRGRSEEEFEKMHQQFQGLSKHKKQSNRKIKHKLMKSPISMGAKPSNSVSPVISKPVQPIQPVVAAAQTAAAAILVPSSSSVVVSNNYVPVAVTQPEFQQHHPVVSVQQPILQLPPPQPQKQQPLPALSSIQSPSLVQLSSNQPPLLNKFTNIVTPTPTSSPSAAVAKKSLIKAELVPIKQPLAPIQKIEHIDVEASLDTHTTPILIKPQQKQQVQQLQPHQRMPSLILDTKTIQKSKTNKILMPIVSSQASQPPPATLTTPIEVSTPAGIQTVHVSVATTAAAPTTVGGTHLIKTSSLPSMSVTSQQSILINQNRSQSPMYIASATANKKPTIKPPPLIAQSAGHSYIIPMTIGNNPQQQLQQQPHKVLTAIPSTQPKLFKAVMPALTSTNAPKVATSLLQHHHTQAKTIARAVPPGKSLISPSVAAANLSLQQQKLISTGSIRPAGPQQHQKISLTTAKGQPTTLTPSQQRQILQNIIAQQQKSRPNTISLVPGSVVVSGSQQIQQPHLQTIQQPHHLHTIQQQQQQQQQQKTVIVAQQPATIVHQKNIQTPAAQSNVTTIAQLVSSSTITTPSSVTTVTTAAPGTSLINRQIIQFQQTNSQPQQTTTGKVQTVSAASLTPQQQQNLLQSIKQQQIRVQNQQATATPQQQSLIMKQQQVLQQIQKQLQQQQLQQQQPGVMKAGQSLLGINATIVSQVPTIQTTASPTVTRIVKPQLVQQHHQQQQQQQQLVQQQQPQLIQVSHGTVNNIVTTTARSGGTNVMTTAAAPPMMAKVLTNSSGQIISLENLLQKQGTGNSISAGTTLRVAGAKPGQTSLIQLAGATGTQMAQYAVVSQGPQGRNLISLATPQRLITTQASTSTVSTTMSQLRKTGASNIVQQQQHQPKLMQVAQTISGTTGQQLVNAKVLGVQTPYRMKAPTTGIRMMNASNLNIAHIAGKPVIISSKPVNSANGQPGQGQAQQQQLQQLPRQNVIWQSATPTGSGAAGGQQPTNFVIGGQAVKVQGNVLQHFDAGQSGQVVGNNTQTVMFGNQMVKLQAAAPNQMQNQQQHIVVSSAGGNVLTGSRTVVLGTSGQTIRVHSPAQHQIPTSGTVSIAQQQQQQQQLIVGKNVKNAVKGNQVVSSTGQQRVVLAVQGGGQILLPSGFQGGSINLKSLQGLKVIPIQQQNKGDANNDRQIFAQIISSPQAPRPPGGNS